MWHPRGWEDRWVTAEVSAPAPWARGQEGNRLHRAQCCTGFVFLLRPPLLHEHQNKTQTANAAGELLLLDCIDRGGPSLQRKVHLGCGFSCIFLFTAARWEPGAPWLQFSDQVSAGLAEHSEKQSYGVGVPPAPGFPQATTGTWQGEHRPWAAGATCSLYLIVWAAGDALFLGMMNSLEAPNGDGVGWPGIAFHQRTKSALGTFAQPHSISRGAGTGLRDGGAEHSVTTSGSPSLLACALGVQGRGSVLLEGGVAGPGLQLLLSE